MPATRHRRTLAAILAAVLAGAAGPAAGRSAPPAPEPLGAEIERWTAFLRTHADTGALWAQVRQGAEPALARARQALVDGRPLLALLRFSSAHETLAAMRYVSARPREQRQDLAAFEAEWRRVGGELAADVGAAVAPSVLAGVRPAAVRAIGEAALPPVRVYHEASLDYGRSTAPDNGLYYLGAAQARRDFAALTRGLGSGEAREAPPLRALGPELDALEGELLAAYRPPASIDAHPQFIAASATLKEARELDAAGLRHGALLRYLQAVQRVAMIRGAGKAEGGSALAARVAAGRTRVAGAAVDHSIALLFVEAAEADLAEPPPDGPTLAAAVAGAVLPGYFGALEPAAPAAAHGEAEVTVTLVRWPYT